MDRSVLLAKLAAVREKAVEDSKLPEPFPLAAVLAIYNKAPRECYIDYLQGATALVDALAPIDIPAVPEAFVIPDLLGGYELDQLARLISDQDKQFNLTYLVKVRRAIVYTLLTTTYKEASFD